jgi:hypothetical protein
MRLVGWVLWVLFYSCLFHSVDSKVISEFLDTLTGTWKLQWTLSDTREQLLWNSHSCCSHCVRHLYWTPSLGEEFTLQGSYLEFDQERVVNNSISLVLVGFAQNDTVKISLQDSRYSDDNHLVSFHITKDDERKVFYMMVSRKINRKWRDEIFNPRSNNRPIHWTIQVFPCVLVPCWSVTCCL